MKIYLSRDKIDNFVVVEVEDGKRFERKMIDLNLVDMMGKAPVIFQILHDMDVRLKEISQLGDFKWKPYPKTMPSEEGFYIISCRCGVTIADFRFGKFDTILEVEAWMHLPKAYKKMDS